MRVKVELSSTEITLLRNILVKERDIGSKQIHGTSRFKFTPRGSKIQRILDKLPLVN